MALASHGFYWPSLREATTFHSSSRSSSGHNATRRPGGRIALRHHRGIQEPLHEVNAPLHLLPQVGHVVPGFPLLLLQQLPRPGYNRQHTTVSCWFVAVHHDTRCAQKSPLHKAAPAMSNSRTVGNDPNPLVAPRELLPTHPPLPKMAAPFRRILDIDHLLVRAPKNRQEFICSNLWNPETRWDRKRKATGLLSNTGLWHRYAILPPLANSDFLTPPSAERAPSAPPLAEPTWPRAPTSAPPAASWKIEDLPPRSIRAMPPKRRHAFSTYAIPRHRHRYIVNGADRQKDRQPDKQTAKSQTRKL